MVGPPLPVTKAGLGVCTVRERMAVPEFFAIDAMTALDLAVLLRPPRFDVSVAHAGGLHP